MAIINTLRNKGGRILVVVIVLALAAFIVGDPSTAGLFTAGPSRDIAEIDGRDFTYEDFQAKLDQLARVYALNTGQNPQGPDLDNVRAQAWQAFIIESLYEPEFEAIDLKISDAEWRDMVQGDNVHPHVVQLISTQYGGFDKTYVTQTINSINEMARQGVQGAAERKEWWYTFEQTLLTSRKLMRLDALMDKTNYATTAEGKMQHMSQNSNATIEYVYVPFSSITDSTVSVSTDELESYLQENAKAYDRPESRDIAFVSFPVVPSAADSAVVIEDMNRVIAGLQTAQNDSAFAYRESDGNFPFMTYRRSSLPEFILTEEGEPIEIGTVTEISNLADRMVVYKMSRLDEGAEYMVKASHILIKWDDESDAAKATARTKANDILKRARRGEDWDQLAADNSQDPSNAQTGGDLSWFSESGPMVPDFNEPIFAYEGTGVMPTLVETQFGFHIVRVDEAKDNTEFKVAIVEKEFFVSNETLEDAYRKASTFRASVNNATEFNSVAEEQGLEVQGQRRVSPSSQRIGGILNGRALAMWLYNEAKVGSVSDVFELDNQYVVASMTGMQEKGVARLIDVENQVTLQVRNEKKAKMISDKLNDLGDKAMTELASDYGDGATAGEATVTLSSNSITGVGLAPEAVGIAFAMNEGDKTAAVEVNNGVVLMRLITKNMASETEDYSMYLQQLVNQRGSRKIPVADFPLTYFRVLISQDLDIALKELSGLEDLRHKFF